MNLASDATASVTAKGDVQITVSNGKQDKAITLQNTLYVPSLRTNLLSIAKIVDRKHQVLFTENRAYVRDSSGNTKMIADRVTYFTYVMDVIQHTQRQSTRLAIRRNGIEGSGT